MWNMNFILICCCRKGTGYYPKGVISSRWMKPGFTTVRGAHRFGLPAVGRISRTVVIAFLSVTHGPIRNLDVSKSRYPRCRLQTVVFQRRVAPRYVYLRAYTAVFPLTRMPPATGPMDVPEVVDRTPGSLRRAGLDRVMRVLRKKVRSPVKISILIIRNPGNW